MKIMQYEDYMFESIVGLYYDMIREMHKEKAIGSKRMFYREVELWIQAKRHIVALVDDGKVVGFSKSYIDYHNGLYEPEYYTELLYIEPSNRMKTGFKMLADNIYQFAKELDLRNVIEARVDNGFSNLIEKHYNTKTAFIRLEAKDK